MKICDIILYGDMLQGDEYKREKSKKRAQGKKKCNGNIIHFVSL